MPATAVHEILLVPQQFPTIQAALDAASGPATILVAPELYAETLRIIDKPYVVLQSTRLSRRGVTISDDGGSGAEVLRIGRSTLHLSGIEVRSNACRRGLLVVNSSLSLQECVVAGNHVGEGADEPCGAGMLCRGSRVRNPEVHRHWEHREQRHCAGAGIYFHASLGCQLGGSVIMGNGIQKALEERRNLGAAALAPLFDSLRLHYRRYWHVPAAEFAIR